MKTSEVYKNVAARTTACKTLLEEAIKLLDEDGDPGAEGLEVLIKVLDGVTEQFIERCFLYSSSIEPKAEAIQRAVEKKYKRKVRK